MPEENLAVGSKCPLMSCSCYRFDHIIERSFLMKKFFTTTAFILLATLSFAQDLNWGPWQVFECFKGISFRVRRTKDEPSKYGYIWYIQFRNSYKKRVAFDYTMEANNEAVNKNMAEGKGKFRTEIEANTTEPESPPMWTFVQNPDIVYVQVGYLRFLEKGETDVNKGYAACDDNMQLCAMCQLKPRYACLNYEKGKDEKTEETIMPLKPYKSESADAIVELIQAHRLEGNGMQTIDTMYYDRYTLYVKLSRELDNESYTLFMKIPFKSLTGYNGNGDGKVSFTGYNNWFLTIVGLPAEVSNSKNHLSKNDISNIMTHLHETDNDTRYGVNNDIDKLFMLAKAVVAESAGRDAPTQDTSPDKSDGTDNTVSNDDKVGNKIKEQRTRAAQRELAAERVAGKTQKKIVRSTTYHPNNGSQAASASILQAVPSKTVIINSSNGQSAVNSKQSDNQVKSATSTKVVSNPSADNSENNNLTSEYCYNKGQTLSNNQNNTEALKWYLKAANMGRADAMFEAGRLYLHVAELKNYELAEKYYNLSAKAGNIKSIWQLGLMHSWGTGFPKDEAKAMELFISAANAGCSEAMASIALAYLWGLGVEQNKNIAKKWYKKSCDAGFEFACEELQDLK